MRHTFSKRDSLSTWLLSVLTLSLLALAGCARTVPPAASSSAESAAVSAPEPASVPRVENAAQISRGAQLFSQNCAKCHGAQAEGGPDWENLDAVGMQRAPPLNGGGHIWHHPVPIMRQVIKEGTLDRGGAMPPHEGVLTDQQVDDIIAWYLHLWSEERYQGWYRKWHHRGLPRAGDSADG